MEVWRILQKMRDDSRNFDKHLRELEQILTALSRVGPFIGRILTPGKFYAGRVEKLELNDGHLEFTIANCDGQGKTSNGSKPYRKKIPWEDLGDVQVFKDCRGKLIWLSDLFNEDKNGGEKNG